jgi:hypothetical protein
MLLFLCIVSSHLGAAACCCCVHRQLKPLAWAEYGPQKLYVLQRNLTIRSTFKPYGLLDFQQLERKVLLDAGVTVTFKSIVLQNIRCVQQPL